MNYTVNGKNYTADDGFVFCNKESGMTFKKMRMSKNDSIDNYDVIEIPPEPILEKETDTEDYNAEP